MNKYEQADLIWPVIKESAKNNKIITYGDVSRQVGARHSRWRHALGLIQEWVIDNNLPRITGIVVHGDIAAKPGEGFLYPPGKSLKQVQDEIFLFDWNSFNPKWTEAVNIIDNSNQTDEPDYKVPDIIVNSIGRGIFQKIFRERIMKNYNYQCSLCEISIPELLVAGHIVPWSIDNENRLNPRNGILLCVLHDKLYENDYIGIDQNGKVYLSIYFGNRCNRYGINTGDKLRIPEKKILQPDPVFLEWKYNSFLKIRK